MPFTHVTHVLLAVLALSHSPQKPLPDIVANDNRAPAGLLRDGVFTLELHAEDGIWRPHGERGAALRVAAFGAGSGLLSIPSPLIRVPSGTTIVASVRNDLPTLLRVHGLCERGTVPCSPLDVPSGETRRVQFASGVPGTYHYWATM